MNRYYAIQSRYVGPGAKPEYDVWGHCYTLRKWLPEDHAMYENDPYMDMIGNFEEKDLALSVYGKMLEHNERSGYKDSAYRVVKVCSTVVAE